MADLIIQGGKPLQGTITPSGYKNSIVALIPATLFTDAPVTFTNVPDITDVRNMLRFLKSIGSKITWQRAENTLRIDNSHLHASPNMDKYPTNMGSAKLLIPGLLHRYKTVRIPNKLKGCTLGVRDSEVDYEFWKKMGVKVRGVNGSREFSIPDKFRACEHWADYQGVTSTENFILSAIMANGHSILLNSASEPQVQDLSQFLMKLGAQIEGAGSNKLSIEGVRELSNTPVNHRVTDDYYEVATFLALGAMTGGKVTVNMPDQQYMGLIYKTFDNLGVHLDIGSDTVTVLPDSTFQLKPTEQKNMLRKVEAAPWPYFPADLMPPFMALATRVDGTLLFWNKIYEGAMHWITELMKFGAHVHMSDPHRVIVFGGKRLNPAVVDAPYIIRVAVALFMVSASIPGRSVVKSADTIKRAHPHFVQNLHKLGADVEWAE